MNEFCGHGELTPCWKLTAYPVVNGEPLPADALASRRALEGVERVLFTAEDGATAHMYISDLVELAAQADARVANRALGQQVKGWGSVSRGMRSMHAENTSETMAKALVSRLMRVNVTRRELALSGQELRVMSLVALGYDNGQIERILRTRALAVRGLIAAVGEKTNSSKPEQTVLALFRLGKFALGASRKPRIQVADGMISSTAVGLLPGPIEKPQGEATLDRLDTAAQRYQLTSPEKIALRHRLEGLSNTEASIVEKIAEGTVRKRITSCFDKLETSDIDGAAIVLSGVNVEEWSPSAGLLLDPKEWIMMKGWAQRKASIDIEKELRPYFDRMLTPHDSAEISARIIVKLGARNRVHALWLALTAED